MEFSAQMIAQFLGGTIEGDKNAKVTTVAKIEEGFEGALSFLANPKYTNYIYSTKSSIVLVNNIFKPEQAINTTLIRVEDPYAAFARLLELYAQSKQPKNEVEKHAFISRSAKVSQDVYVGAFSYISAGANVGRNVKIYPQVYIGQNVKIGEGTIIYPGVKIYEECVIGENCIIHAGAVIGADGFGFAPQTGTDYKKIPQIGNAIIEDNVEIGANATVDRATIGSTILRRGVKIDDHVHIAHNVEIGENTVMAAQCGVAGSCKIGKNCMFGGQVGISPHSVIADGVLCGAKTGIPSSITKENTVVFGHVAREVSKERRSQAVYRNLPEMYKRMNELEKIVAKLQEELDKKQ